MLLKIRERLTGWFSYAFVALIAIIFLLFGLSGTLINRRQHEPIAVVNGVAIDTTAFRRIYRQQRQVASHVHTNGALTANEQLALKYRILNNLIEQALIRQLISHSGFVVTEAQFQHEVLSMPVFMVDGQFSAERFAQVAAQMALTLPELKALIMDGLVLRQLPVAFELSGSLPHAQLERLYGILEQTRQIRYAVIHKNKFQQPIQLSRDEMMAYYAANKEAYIRPAEVKLSYVRLSPDQMTIAPITEDAAMAYYTAHQNTFNSPPMKRISHVLIQRNDPQQQRKVAAVLARLQKGEKIAQLAKQYSADKTSANKGGDIGWQVVTKKATDPLNTAIQQLQHVNQWIGPIKTQYGLQFIQLTAEQQATQQSYDVVKKEIKALLRQQTRQDQYQQQLEELSAAAFEHPDTLVPVAELAGRSIEETAYFSRDSQPQEGILVNPSVIQAAFESSVYEHNNNSELIALGNETYVVIRKSGSRPREQRSYQAVQHEIRQRIMQQKRHQQVKSVAQTVLSALQQGQSSRATRLLKQYGSQWVGPQRLGRDASTLPIAIRDKAFHVSLSEPDNKAYALQSLETGDIAVVAVSQSKNGNLTKLSTKERKTFLDSIQQFYGGLEYQALASTLRADADVKIDETRLAAVS